MHETHLIVSAVYAHQNLAYAILVFAMLVEGGEVSLPMFGALARTGAVDFFTVASIGIAATIVYDALFWWLGQHILKHGVKKILFIDIRKVEIALARMRPSIGLFVFFSKFAYGLNRVMLAAVGYLNIRLQRVLSYSIPAAILWTFSLISLGYIFADRAQIFHKRIERLGFFVIAALVVIIVFELYIKHVVARFLSGPVDDRDIPKPQGD